MLPPFDEFPVLASDRILMRQIIASDAKDILEIAVYDGIRASDVADAITMQNKIDINYAEGDSVHWGIIDRQTNATVGTCGYYRGFAGNTGELGCILLPQFRGMGYMSEAFTLAIEFGLNIMKLDKVIAITTADNIKARRLLELLQFILVSESGDAKLTYEYHLPGAPIT